MELRIETVERSLSEAQALVEKYVRPGSSALDDLRQERRLQFASEGLPLARASRLADQGDPDVPVRPFRRQPGPLPIGGDDRQPQRTRHGETNSVAE